MIFAVVVGLLLAVGVSSPASATTPVPCTVNAGALTANSASAGSVTFTWPGETCVIPVYTSLTVIQYQSVPSHIATLTTIFTTERTTRVSSIAAGSITVSCIPGEQELASVLYYWYSHVVGYPTNKVTCSSEPTNLVAAITLGHPDIVRAHFYDASSNIYDAVVTLEEHGAGTSVWSVVGTARTDTNGWVYLGTQPEWWTAYRWVYLGNANFWPAVSNTVAS
jgi:hypothetical protein